MCTKKCREKPSSNFLIRPMIGTVFSSEGIQKFLFSASLGVSRFAKIGIPFPNIVAPFVGGVEIIFGFLVLIGFYVRFTALPLLTVISVAIFTIKNPTLFEKGFWVMKHESRTGYAMLVGLIFLICCSSSSEKSTL